jgi:DNA-binding transcriptional MerR regulator/effector-binding domain-containing protein
LQKIYLSTGEFAKICNINKKTLFYYAEEGIFQPEIIKPNGYHYYAYDQLYIFYVIRALREIGLSIHEIKYHIANRTPENFHDLLKQHQKHLQEEIRHKQRLNLLIKNKLQLFKESQKIETNKIEIKALPTSTLLLSEALHPPCSEAEEHRIVQEHINYCLQNSLNIGYPLGGMLHKENILSGKFENYSYCFTKTHLSSKGKAPTCAKPFIQPAGLYAIGYFYGFYSNNYNGAYQKLLEFLQENQYEIEDYAYEEGIIDELSSNNEDSYITRIAIKIKENESMQAKLSSLQANKNKV